MATSHDIEQVLDAFDDAWGNNQLPRIRDYLGSNLDAHSEEILVELIKVDIEYRWRLAPLDTPTGTVTLESELELHWRSTVEDYARLFPEVYESPFVLASLLAEEFRVRHAWGDKPSIDILLARYPQLPSDVKNDLRVLTDKIDTIKFARNPQPLQRPEENRKRTMEDIQAGETIQDFQLILELGRGAFARVFLAQQISMQRIVALKITEQSSVESPLLSNLDHPNIVRVYDERIVDGLSLLYMQYIPGRSLRQVIQASQSSEMATWSGAKYLEYVESTQLSKGENPLHSETGSSLAQLTWGETVAWIGARLAHALEHAHRKQIWHRDIKPENILIAADGRPMLADFNLSFGADVDSSQRREEFGGTYPYMSPEHIDVLLNRSSPASVNASSDIYSLGVVLWELLTGSRPFPDPTTRDQTGFADLRKSRSKMPKLDGDCACPKGLSEVLLLCLSPTPQDRPTAKQLARSLQYCTLSDIHGLLYPRKNSAIARWQAHPMIWLILLGLIPNGLVAGLSVWANLRLMIENFDQDFFRDWELFPVNCIVFPVGIVVSLWIIWPIVSGVNKLARLQSITPATRSIIARRCLTAPSLSAANILALFSVSGLVFPIWNQWSPNSHITMTDILGFFLSQVLHGLVAAGSTFVITAFATLRAFYPMFISPEESLEQQRELDWFEKRYLTVTNIMALTPLLALLALAVADHIDKGVFIAIAMAGFASHMLSSSLTTMIRSGVSSLRFALSPTTTLLQRDSSHRHS